MRVPIDDVAFLDLDAPTVAAWEIIRPNGSVAYLVWCRYCERWHEHGPAEGHRASHCDSDTPYTATGYNPALAGEWAKAFA